MIQSPVQNPIQNIIQNGIFDPDGAGEIVFKLHNSKIREIIRGLDGTFTRATTATVEDHEGVIREVLSGEARFQGQRRVYNGYTNSGDSSEDLTTIAASFVANNVITATAMELTGTNNSYSYLSTPAIYVAGSDVVFRAKVQWISGATDVGIRLVPLVGGTDDEVVIDLSDGLEHVVSLAITVGADSKVDVGIDNRSAIIAGVDTGATKITFTEIQLQNKTGASDPTVPDGYCSTGVLSAPYHGAGVDGVKYLLTDNSGTSVTDNIVTEATGSPITDAIGYFGEPASTNKCTNYNANPDSGLLAMGSVAAFNAAVTNVSVFDAGTGCLFGVVDGSAAIAAAGLDGICTAGLLLKIDNTSGSAVALMTPAGAAGNTNAHSLSAWIMADAGSAPKMQFNGTGGQVSTTSTSLVKVTSENITPADAGRALQFQVDVGDVGYFILNQLEESAFVTSEIITEGSAVTRNKDDYSLPTTNIPVNDCVFSFDWTPTAAGQGTLAFLGTGSAAGYLAAYITGTTLTIVKKSGGVVYTITKTISYVANTTYSLKIRLDSTSGLAGWFDNAKATTSANTEDGEYAATINIGAYFDGTSIQTGGINNFKVHSGTFTDAEVVAL